MLNIDPTIFLIASLIIGGFGFLLLITTVGITLYWLFSDVKDPLESDIKDIKNELQKLPTVIVAILKHPPEVEKNAEVTTKQERTKPQTPKPKPRNK